MPTIDVGQVCDWLNVIAPFESAEDFDNVGLLLGDRGSPVRNVLFGMDVTDALVEQAVSLSAELIITHHPFIFTPMRRIDYTGPQGRALLKLMRAQISVIAAHTNWDKAPEGISDSLANALGLREQTRGDDFLRIGSLPSSLSGTALKEKIQSALQVNPRLYGDPNRQIERVAVAGGAYGEGYALAASLGAQAYVVGEIKHHEVLDACARGMTVFDAGHFATELPGVAALYERFLSDAVRAKWPIRAHLHLQAPYAGATLAF